MERVRRYLPSTQFLVILAALAVAGGLVLAAQYTTKPPQAPTLAAAQTAGGTQTSQDWLATLEQIQAASGVSLPQAPSQATVNQLLAGVQSSNLTDTVAKSLLINLASVKAQGLGDDIPTQEQLVSEASAQVSTSSLPAYTQADLQTVPQTKDSLHTYGNAVASAFAAHPNANYTGLLILFGYMLDYQDSNMVQPINQSAEDYIGFARDIAALPVPETLAPLDLKLVNDLAGMGEAAGDMSFALSDPARGLVGLQQFEALSNEVVGMFTAMNSDFKSDGIIFNKDEPGASWSAFLSP